jgi:indolepyruvate ferredoxin oxidoreductase
MERELIREYERSVEELIKGLSAQNHALAVQIASVPEDMRGFGYIKQRNVEAARKKRDELLARFGAAQPPARAAA